MQYRYQKVNKNTDWKYFEIQADRKLRAIKYILTLLQTPLQPS